jgi:hypothetical protein
MTPGAFLLLAAAVQAVPAPSPAIPDNPDQLVFKRSRARSSATAGREP